LLHKNKCNNAIFHKTALAHTSHGSATAQLRWDDRFNSRYADQFWL